MYLWSVNLFGGSFSWATSAYFPFTGKMRREKKKTMMKENIRKYRDSPPQAGSYIQFHCAHATHGNTKIISLPRLF